MPTREEMIATIQGGDNTMPTKEQMINSLKGKWGNIKPQIRAAIDTAGSSLQEATDELAAIKPRERAIAKGPEAVARLDRAEAMNPIEKLGQGVINESNKLLLGAADMTVKGAQFAIPSYEAKTDRGKQVLENMFGSTRDYSKNMAEYQAQRDIEQEEFESQAGVPGFVGKMVPYMVGEATLAPKFVKGAADVSSIVANTLGDATRGLVGKLASKSKKAPINIFNDILKNMKGQKSTMDLDNVGVTSDILGNLALGTLEGAAHYDYSALGGGVESALGSISGKLLNPVLSKKASYRNKQDLGTINAMKKKHKRVSPAIETGREDLIDTEKGLRNESNLTANYMKQWDRGNKQIDNEIAYQAMGIPKNKAANMTTDEFATHLDNISVEYEDLVGKTRAHFSADQWNDFNAMADKLKKEGNVDIVASVEQITNNLKRNATQGRTATGKFLPKTFDGKTFQMERKRIKAKLASAYNNGDREMVDALEPLLKEMDSAIDRGMKMGGTASAKQWKDVNEKNAMAEILTGHGLTKHGDVDPGLLESYFKKDNRRILTGKGNKIKDLHLIAKYNELARTVGGGSLTGLNLTHHGQGRQSLFTKLLFNPLTDKLRLGQRTALNTYMKGYPSQYGVLGMNRTGSFSPMALSRSMNQASDFRRDVADNALEAYDWAEDKGNAAIDSLMDWFKDKDEDQQ